MRIGRVAIVARSMMRVGFLALQAPGCSPSQRYRVEAFADPLHARGITFDCHWVLDRDDLRTFYGQSSTAAKSAVATRALVRRLRSLATLRPPDVWLVQREAFFLGGAWSEWLAGRRAPVVFDFDDAIWIRATSAANARFARLKNVEKFPAIAALAHTVVAGNQYLADWAAPYARRLSIIPTCVDTELFAPMPALDRDGPVVVGWSGSASTLEHLRPLLPVLERLKARFGRRVAVRVMGDPAFVHPPLDLVGEAWSLDAELALLRRMDIGVMPLPEDPWTRGKCGLKGLVAMSVGAATVMSPVGVNADIVDEGVNGFTARSDDEWLEVLSRLVEDAALRARVGAAGRQTVTDRYSVSRWAPVLADVLEASARR